MASLFQDALGRFGDLLAEAKKQSLNEPTAATLATVGSDGQPSARVILLKHFDERGFVFYTNFQSRKGREIQETQRAALCFFWDPLMEQVRIEGRVTAVSDEEADAYWQTRERASRIGAWASEQSRVLESREAFERRVESFSSKYPDDDIPRPSHWSGFRIAPTYIEFWRAQKYRLHERHCYRYEDETGWTLSLLYP